jgi:hypothetical protein
MRYPRVFPGLGMSLSLTGAIMLVAFCGAKQSQALAAHYRQLDDISAARWKGLAGKRIFFGHKSVGQNIIEGLQDVLRARPQLTLTIRETSEGGDFDEPVLAHAALGKNKDPLSKITAFRELMRGGLGEKLDVAFFKLCFVDIDHTTDIDTLFDQYSETIRLLSAEFPHLKILTSTVPLLSKPVGIKERLKKLLGRLPWEEEDNIKRNLYNEKLRRAFGDSLFDLAACEATDAAGKKSFFTKDGRKYERLRKEYTDDGGHLNPLGRQVVAIGLLKRLAVL